MKKFKTLLCAYFSGIFLLCSILSHAQQSKNDTIKVVMLVSDTLNVTKFHEMSDKKITANRLLFDMYRNVFVMFGYSVRKLHAGSEPKNDSSYCIDCPDYWEHLFYLDNEKKRISGLIVWESVIAK